MAKKNKNSREQSESGKSNSLVKSIDSQSKATREKENPGDK